jgi:hypothetical protein
MKSKIIKLKPKTFVEEADRSRMLLREFIHDRLYGAPEPKKNMPGGYFTQKNH